MAYTYSKIASVTIGSNGSSSMDFLAIPQNYTDLVLKISTRVTNGGGYYDGLNINFNGLASGWTAKVLNGAGTTASSLSSTSDRNYVGDDQLATANTFSNVELYIPNYASGVYYKSISSDMASETNDSTNNYLRLGAILWSNSSPITSISVYDSGKTFAQYSTATLYGIKAEV